MPIEIAVTIIATSGAVAVALIGGLVQIRLTLGKKNGHGTVADMALALVKSDKSREGMLEQLMENQSLMMDKLDHHSHVIKENTERIRRLEDNVRAREY